MVFHSHRLSLLAFISRHDDTLVANERIERVRERESERGDTRNRGPIAEDIICFAVNYAFYCVYVYVKTFPKQISPDFAFIMFYGIQVYSTAMGGVGLACPLVVPPIRSSMGYPTYNYYGAKSRCGELDYRYVAYIDTRFEASFVR